MVALAAPPKGPVQLQLDRLDAVFGPEYFEQGRLLVTVARDAPGAFKAANKLQHRLNEAFGATCEVIFEHVKHELWSRYHEAASTVGLRKGDEVPECQVTQVPEGVRVHPYRRDQLPSIEVLILWEDASRTTRGHCLYSVPYPEVPALDKVHEIFEEIEPYFAKRWLVVNLSLGPPVRGMFDAELGREVTEISPHETQVGAGVAVTILACHPLGFAREQGNKAAMHVASCQPIAFRGVTDEAGRAKICFLPAEINKIRVDDTDGFHGSEMTLRKGDVKGLAEGSTAVSMSLTPKALASVTVYVFAMPRKLPSSDETDGIIDWAAEERDALPDARAEIAMLKDGDAPVALRGDGAGTFIVEDGGLPEGCVELVVRCPGYEDEERPIMLLVGMNEFYIPLRKAR